MSTSLDKIQPFWDAVFKTVYTPEFLINRAPNGQCADLTALLQGAEIDEALFGPACTSLPEKEVPKDFYTIEKRTRFQYSSKSVNFDRKSTSIQYCAETENLFQNILPHITCFDLNGDAHTDIVSIQRNRNYYQLLDGASLFIDEGRTIADFLEYRRSDEIGFDLIPAGLNEYIHTFCNEELVKHRETIEDLQRALHDRKVEVDPFKAHPYRFTSSTGKKFYVDFNFADPSGTLIPTEETPVFTHIHINDSQMADQIFTANPGFLAESEAKVQQTRSDLSKKIPLSFNELLRTGKLLFFPYPDSSIFYAHFSLDNYPVRAQFRPKESKVDLFLDGELGMDSFHTFSELWSVKATPGTVRLIEQAIQKRVKLTQEFSAFDSNAKKLKSEYEEMNRKAASIARRLNEIPQASSLGR